MSASADDADGAFRMTWDCIRSRCPSGGCARHVVRRSSVKRVPARERGRRRQDDAMLRLEWNALRVGDKVPRARCQRRRPAPGPRRRRHGGVGEGLRIVDGIGELRVLVVACPEKMACQARSTRPGSYASYYFVLSSTIGGGMIVSVPKGGSRTIENGP